VFPVRYELNSYTVFRRSPAFEEACSITRNLVVWTYCKNILATPRDLASAKEIDPNAPVGMP
jgi:hypothetical protein